MYYVWIENLQWITSVLDRTKYLKMRGEYSNWEIRYSKSLDIRRYNWYLDNEN